MEADKLRMMARAIQDVFRAAAVWGGEKNANNDPEWAMSITLKSIHTLLTLILDRSPTDEEMAWVFE